MEQRKYSGTVRALGGKTPNPNKPIIPIDSQKAAYKNSSFGRDTYVLPEDLFREYTYRELEYSSYQYVPFLTGSNNLLDMAYAALMTSATNRAIIKRKVNWTVGGGFVVTGKRGRFDKEATMPNEAQKMALGEWMDRQNPEGESLEVIFEKAAFDGHTWGNVFIEFIQTSQGGQNLFFQRHLPVEQCRLAKMTNEEVEPSAVGISKYWLDTNDIEPSDLVTLPLYPNWAEIDGTKRCVYHIKDYNPLFKYYGCPDYIAGLIACDNDYQIDKYNNSRFKNGFIPSAFMTVYGAATADEAKELIEEIEDVYTGTGSNSKMFVQCLADKADQMDVKILDDRKEGAFTELSNITDEKIVRSHRFTPSLAGISTAGKLGSNQEIRTEFEIVYGDVIRPMQCKLMAWVNTSIKECEAWQGDNFGTNLDVQTPNIVSLINSIAPAQILTINEQRKLNGYEPLDGGDILLSGSLTPPIL